MSNDPLKLDEPGEWAGLWWLPEAPDERLPGVMRYDGRGGLSLSLIGAFEERIFRQLAPGVKDELEGVRVWDVIYGVAQQREITLLGCIRTKSRRRICARVESPDTQTVSATTAIIGAHVSGREDAAFEAAEISVEDLMLWAASSVFSAHHGTRNGIPDGTGAISVKPVAAQSATVNNTEYLLEHGSVIGCKQFSCSGDAVRRLIMGCRRMLSVEDRAAIMAGLEAGLSQTRIAHLIGRSPSVVCREIARHRGPGGVYQAEDAGRAAQVARRRPKKRLLDRDEILRRRVIFDLSQGRTPRQISGRLSVEACGTVAPMDNSPHAQGRTISHEAIYTWIYAHPKKTLIEHGVCLPSRRWMRKKPPAGGRTPPIVGMRLIDERPDIADRMIPGNWEGDLIIGKDGASACATLVERTTRYLIIVALPLGRRADQVCDALTRRIQGLPEGAMRTLTWDQGREMARHQRLTQDTGVEVFFAHPHSPWERGTNENTNRLIRRYLPKGTPITSHQPYLDAIAYELNNCPRATLGYRTPTEAFNQLIATTH